MRVGDYVRIKDLGKLRYEIRKMRGIITEEICSNMFEIQVLEGRCKGQKFTLIKSYVVEEIWNVS